MKKLLLITTLLITSYSYSQKIKGIKYEFGQNEYNNWNLTLIPNAFDGYASETTKTSGVYAVLLCYTIADKQYEKYIDCTSDFVKERKKDIHIAMSSRSRSDINIVRVDFFRRDLPRETWAQKNCF